MADPHTGMAQTAGVQKAAAVGTGVVVCVPVTPFLWLSDTGRAPPWQWESPLSFMETQVLGTPEPTDVWMSSLP